MNSNFLLLLALLSFQTFALAGALEEGDNALQEERYSDAYKILLPEAVNGDSFAQHNIALLLSKGLGVNKSEKEAFKWYTLAANQGYADSKVNLALMYTKGDVIKQDHFMAVRLLREAAEAGVPMAQNNLGSAYLFGEGIEKNPKNAAKWFRMAAEQGLPMAQFSLALLYCNGQPGETGVDRNSDECTKWLYAAAESNYEPAKSAIFSFTKKSAIEGNPESMHNLGGYFLKGYGTSSNPDSGIMWLTKAAEAGLMRSKRVLHKLYEVGSYGIPPDKIKAAYWQKQADN